jgi:hypothetical protein
MEIPILAPSPFPPGRGVLRLAGMWYHVHHSVLSVWTLVMEFQTSWDVIIKSDEIKTNDVSSVKNVVILMLSAADQNARTSSSDTSIVHDSTSM